MNVELVRATPNDEPTLSRLAQLYAYDFSAHMELDVGDDGLFRVGSVLARSWLEPGRHVFLIRVDVKIAGFVVLHDGSRLTGAPDVMDVAEFFVMRKYRRKGIGSICAAHLFDLFRGKWEVRQTEQNFAGTAFWRKTIHEYTGGSFQEMLLNDERWRGPVQTFDTREAKGNPR